MSSTARLSRVDLVDGVAAPQRRVGLAIGDVRAEPAVLCDYRLARDRIVAKLLQRRRWPPAGRASSVARTAPRASSSVMVNSCSSESSDRGVAALAHVRAVAAVLRA